MDKQAAFWLDALGANGELSATMKHELDTQGYTIVHGIADDRIKYHFVRAMQDLAGIDRKSVV